MSTQALARRSLTTWFVGMVVVCFGASAQVAGGADPEGDRQIVCLRAAESAMTVWQPSSKLLVREIMRQAVLLSARDEIGLATRDMAQREPFPAGAPVFAIKASRTITTPTIMELGQFEGADSTPTYKKEVPLPNLPSAELDYVGLVVAMEALTRTEFKEFWQKNGFTPVAQQVNPKVAVPANVERALEEMNAFSQFRALRELHALQRREGESPATLAAISRAYANLALLTQLNWNAAHKAYTARALLYAQRLVARDPKSALALYQRAYALALCGLHQLALNDLAAAQRLQDSQPEGAAKSPTWVKVIDSLCRYSTDELTTIAKSKDAHAPLAWVCAYLTVEYGADAQSLRYSTGFESLSAVPECLRISSSISTRGGVSSQHLSTTHGAQVLAQTLGPRCAEMPALPADVTAATKKLPGAEPDARPVLARGADITGLLVGTPAVWQALIAAGEKDRDEPSWSCLGRTIEEMVFLELFRRGDFLRTSLGAPVDEYTTHALKLVSEHPYAVMIESLPVDLLRNTKRLNELNEKIDIVDGELKELRLLLGGTSYANSKKIQGVRAQQLMYAHADNTAYDICACLQYAKSGADTKYAGSIDLASPHCPVGIAALIDSNEQYGPDKYQELEKKFAAQPAVLAALARGYVREKRSGDARRVLDAYIAKSPDPWAYELLAEACLEEGDVEKWRSILDKYLEGEDFGLDHAKVRVKIVKYYVSKKQFEQAKPYADKAAATGASWAMTAAAECYEGLRDWKTAEKLVRYTAERYRGCEPDWYFWCRRTNQGDVAAAQKLANRYFTAIRSGKDSDDLAKLGVFYLLSDDRAEAIKSFRDSLKAYYSPTWGLQLAMLLDEMGDKAERDAALAEVIKRGPLIMTVPRDRFRPHVDFAKQLQKSYANEAEPGLDLSAFEELLKNVGPDYPAIFLSLAGRYQLQHGQKESGQKLLRRSMDEPTHSFNAALAADRLRKSEGTDVEK